jgi:hypothetical protein
VHSEETDREVRQGLSLKARETKELLDKTDSIIQSLKLEYEQANNVVDITKMREFVEIFKNGAFEALSVSAQAEILKDRVRRIILREDGVFQVEIYGEKPGSVWDSKGKTFDSSETGESPASKARSNLSGVRPVFKLVPRARIELARPFNRSPGF